MMFFYLSHHFLCHKVEKKDAAGACFSKGPQTFRSQRQILKSTPVELEAQFLAHKPVNYVSLTDSFIVLFSKLLKLWS